MITLANCKSVHSIEQAALLIANKVAFDKGKGFSRSWDNQTYWEFACNLENQLPKITNQIDNYYFEPCLLRERRVKARTRKLFISTWKDKIVETWLSRAMNKLLSKWFSKRSYAYRIEKIGVDLCQRHVVKALKQSRFLVRRDITSFFYTIDHQILLNTLAKLVDPQLLGIIKQRVIFDYYDENKKLHKAEVGIPFGSPLACFLANVYLTETDRKITAKPVSYFRYADDFLIAATNPDDVLDAADALASEIDRLNIKVNERKSDNFSFDEHPEFTQVNRFKYLGLEYWNDGIVRLPIEKRRKIMNIFKRAISTIKKKLTKIENLDDRLQFAITFVNDAILKRIRYAAIVDYYLKHVEDEEQLRTMDREAAELIISAVLGKPFRKKDFKTIPFKKLRKYGLISLLHRNRLHRHGQLNVPFLSMYNTILFERYQEGTKRRLERINQIRIARKLRTNAQHNPQQEQPNEDS